MRLKIMTIVRQTTVLFIWDVREELREYLQKGLEGLPQVKLIFPEDTKEETFMKYAPKADIIVGWRPTKELLLAARNQKLQINPGVGVQHLTELFKEVAKVKDIILINGHGNTYFTAQHALALLLAVTNKLIPHHQWLKEGQWRKGDADAKSTPVRDLEIGLLGYGAVNQKLHKFMAGFDVSFSVLKRDWKRKRVEQYPTEIKQYTTKDLHSFLKAVDVLFVAVPLTDETEGMLGKKEFELLGKDSFVVTVARGQVIDEESFYWALKNNIIAGAGIDVWYNYRPEPDEDGRKFPSSYPFYELDNVVLSPHRGASPMSDLRRWDEVIENISRFARGQKEFINIVDLELQY